MTRSCVESLVLLLTESHVKVLKVFCHLADLSEYKYGNILNDILYTVFFLVTI